MQGERIRPQRLLGDTLREACGVFGIYARGEDVARLTFFGLYALQHRGQESAGIAVSDGEKISCYREMGLVSQVFDEENLSRLKGHVAVGHTRYSTTGSSLICNAQPILVDSRIGTIALAHNGNLVNSVELDKEVRAAGIQPESTTDSELIAWLIAFEAGRTGNVEEAVINVMPRLKGAYSVCLIAQNKLVGFRDPYGIRPLCVGSFNGSGLVMASETCALNVVGARMIQEMDAGEVLVIDGSGMRSLYAPVERHPSMCMFEFVYLARPDSEIYGKTLHMVRRRMGQLLAAEHPAAADVVIPVPDTGWPAAIGFAEASHIPFGEGLIKNRYIHRTFIQPEQRMRELGVRMKLTPLRETVAGKRVVIVEDTIVRGTTSKQIVRMIREAGAVEAHMRISAPPYAFPCFYGIDTPDRRSLLAAKMSVEQMRQFLGADSLGFLSIQGLMKAVNIPRSKFCVACFTGDYPIKVPRDMKTSKFALEEVGAPA
jgi:amidophosphoribosyltransferase